ncbi:MAG TPA: cysteine desulfurase family protein [Candidatus Obscuribacterales bacterium]
MSSVIYLDNSATTRVRDEVVEAMGPYLTDKWGNPSSIHRLGYQSRTAINTARQQVAELLGASPEEIYFTPCGTYANNVALLGRARYAEESGFGRHMITCCIEHSSSLGPAKYLESKGWEVTNIHVDDSGLINIDELTELIKPETSIISLMWANNEVGTVQPVEKIAAIASERKIFFHSDAIQVPGKLPINLSNVPVSTLSISGHKFYAPKGIGVLFVRKGVPILPVLFGGGQEQGLFPGTEALANIVGVGMAAELAAAELQQNTKHLRAMQKILINKLTSHPAVHLTGADIENRLPGHVSVIVEGTVGEEIVIEADMKGVCISSVSACKQAGHDRSHVLSCMGLPEEQIIGSARITCGRFNTEEQCERAAEILSEIFAKRAKCSAKATA